MSQPYVGEIRMVGFNFAPSGWAFCDGSTISIAENSVLFQLIGTTYGGDGVQTYNLPDLRGRIPFHQGGSFVIGQLAGEENVTLITSQIPQHTHPLAANSSAGSQPSPAGGFWAKSALEQFSTETGSLKMAASAVGSAGGSQPHDNMPPFCAINFVISLFGVFPSQN